MLQSLHLQLTYHSQMAFWGVQTQLGNPQALALTLNELHWHTAGSSVAAGAKKPMASFYLGGTSGSGDVVIYL